MERLDMIEFKSLEHHLDRSFARAHDEMDDAAMDASESASPEDMQAFNDASQKVATATTLMNEGLRAQHGITKAIIDGFQ